MTNLSSSRTVELLDPTYRAQRAKADSRASTTNLSTSDVAANLKRLASQRTDVFDAVTGQVLISEEEAQRRKRAALGAWDGVSVTAGKSGMGGGGVSGGLGGLGGGGGGAGGTGEGSSIEEQIRGIYQKAGKQ